MRGRAIAAAAIAALLGCADPDSGDTGITSELSGAAESGSGSSTAAPTTTEALDSSSGGGADGDPDYPKPDPVAAEGICPSPTFGPITFEGQLWVCLPECMGTPPECPVPATGTAEAACATNPFSSSDPCQDSTDCMVDGEMCGNVGGGAKGCLLPPSHCILRCDAEATCPDGMVCSDASICAYLPSV